MLFTKKGGAPVAAPKLDSRYADAQGRLYFYDNAKFILIFLVVLAHAISPFKSSGPGHEFFYFLWRIINALHMPCLIFISGFFAKKYIRPDGSINLQRPFTYIVYYLVAQFTVGAFEVYVQGDHISKSVLAPRSSLWFLVCLIWWYIFLPLIDKIEPGKMMVIAIVAALLFGYDEKISNLMAMSRMIAHFPFFLFGYYITGEHMQVLFTKKAKLISIPVIILSVGFMVFLSLISAESDTVKFVINRFITCDKSYFAIYKNTSVNPLLWCWPRLVFYITAAALSFSLLVWVPRKKTFFTKFGARTLAVYILHRYIYLLYRQYDWADFDWFKYEWFGWKDILVLRILMIAVVFLLTVVLSLYPCYWPFEKLGKIKVTKLLKKTKAD